MAIPKKAELEGMVNGQNEKQTVESMDQLGGCAWLCVWGGEGLAYCGKGLP